MKPMGNDVTLRKKLYLIMAIIMGAAYTVYCFAISPALIFVGSDIAFEGTVLPTLLEYLGKLVEILAVSAAYALILCGAFELLSENFKGGLLVFSLVTLYKYAGNVAMSWIMNGSIPVLWIWDVVNVIFFTALEAIQLLIVWAIVRHFAAKTRVGADAKGKTALTEGCDWYPFGKFYDGGNPCLKATFYCSLTVVCSKLFGRIVNDIYSLLLGGLPEKAVTWAVMSAYYLFELLFGVICYVVMVFTVTKLMDKLFLKKSES